jgi:predicted nucleic acid-binding protein
MPVVISDTSPLRALAHLGYLEWLQELFRQVCLPPAVAAVCPAVTPLLDRLQGELHFFVSSALRKTILRQAGEAAP